MVLILSKVTRNRLYMPPRRTEKGLEKGLIFRHLYSVHVYVYKGAKFETQQVVAPLGNPLSFTVHSKPHRPALPPVAQ